jgi:hypothetical protein
MKTAVYYVDVYANCLSDDVRNRELAVLGPHLNGLLVTFRGEIPSSSGVQSDQVAWRADKMRRLHRDFARAQELMQCVTVKQYMALVQWRALLGRTPENAPGRLNEATDIAKYLHIEYGPWWHLIQRGLDRINAEMGIIIA